MTNPYDPTTPASEPAGAAPTGYGEPSGYGAPEAAAAPYGGAELASWGRRVGGYLLDVLIIGVPLGLIASSLDSSGQTGVRALAFLILGYLNGTGQTPGKRIVGVRLLRERDGQPLGPGAGIGRQFCHILDALPLLLGFLWPLWDSKKQTFADKIVGSVVIKT